MTTHFNFSVTQGDFNLKIDASVNDGEVLAVLGPNGSGKSTLLRLLSGLQQIDTGHISSRNILWDSPADDIFVEAQQRRVGVVFQDYLLFKELSAVENVAFGLRAQGVNKATATEQARALLQQVGLSEHLHKKTPTLSGGQAQRVALARALAIQPHLLLLDEPLAALDVATRQTVRRDLRRYLSSFQGAVVLVTHDPIDAYALADRVLILENGQVMQIGTLNEVTAHPRSRYVADLVGTNLITGHASGVTLTTSTGITVVLADQAEGDVFAVIKPQAITIVTSNELTSSARNTWPGVITAIDRSSERCRITLHGPLPLVAEITAAAVESMALRVGDEVFAVVKATEVEVYSR